MDADQFRKQTKTFATNVIQFVETLPKAPIAQIIGRQLLRSGMSVGANYRSACRARSCADFIAKMKIVEEECDESLYWLELLIDARQVKPALLVSRIKEANETLSMVVASIKTARSRL